MNTAASASSGPRPDPRPGPQPGPQPTPTTPQAALPLAARRLGYAGLLPFVLGTALVWLVDDEAHPFAARALAAYAGVIVSFLGGLYWGLAMRQAAAPMQQTAPATGLLAWGVVPSLVAWLAVVMPPAAGLVILGVMLVVCYAVDRQQYPAQGVAHWLVLRFRLSAVAALSCFIAAGS